MFTITLRYVTLKVRNISVAVIPYNNPCVVILRTSNEQEAGQQKSLLLHFSEFICISLCANQLLTFFFIGRKSLSARKHGKMRKGTISNYLNTL